jgi:cytochrome c oxidase cbb3-type subunit 2
MGRNLHYVPPTFVALAAALFIVPWMLDAITSGRLSKSVHIQALAVVCVLGAAFALTLIVQPTIRPFASVPVEDPIERGRRVYIAEGCINCHSQYVRPNTADVAMWGPATTLDELRRQRPPLIGNRRQGPDLSRVGARRSPLWLRMHFIQPRDVSYRSPMPPYDYLFRNRRGDDLVAYLSSMNNPQHWKDVAGWQPSPPAWDLAAKADGAALFRQHCATCHTADGAARRKWSASFHRPPPDLALDRLEHLTPNASPSEARTEIARIARFGIQGTDMPGREYLPDDQIAAIADYVLAQRESQLKR